MAPRARPSLTARVIAATRAGLSRPTVASGDAEVEDRLARSLWTPGWFQLPGMAPYIRARTAFFDEVVLRACEAGARQVVVVGAGYDARSLRFRQPGVVFYELDHPATQDDKLARLHGLGVDVDEIRFVPIDLSRDPVTDALAAAGHDPATASHFMCEGVTPYLRVTVLATLLKSLASRALPGSTIAADFVAHGGGLAERVRSRMVRAGTAMMGEPMVTVLTPLRVESLLTDAGWTNVQLWPPIRSLPAVLALGSAA